MSFGSGASAAARAKRKGKALTFLKNTKQVRDLALAAQTAKGGMYSAAIGSGEGLESSGVNAARGAVSSQFADEYGYARQTGALRASMQRDISTAKRKARGFKIAVSTVAAATAAFGGAALAGTLGVSAGAGAVAGASLGAQFGGAAADSISGDAAEQTGGNPVEGIVKGVAAFVPTGEDETPVKPDYGKSGGSSPATAGTSASDSALAAILNPTKP